MTENKIYGEFQSFEMFSKNNNIRMIKEKINYITTKTLYYVSVSIYNNNLDYLEKILSVENTVNIIHDNSSEYLFSTFIGPKTSVEAIKMLIDFRVLKNSEKEGIGCEGTKEDGTSDKFKIILSKSIRCQNLKLAKFLTDMGYRLNKKTVKSVYNFLNEKMKEKGKEEENLVLKSMIFLKSFHSECFLEEKEID
jgi:hypothetical protein